MKIGDVISEDTKRELHRKARRMRKWKKENLSFKDIESLMGIHRERYGRGRGGAMKRR